jgi:hypothetical protein
VSEDGQSEGRRGRVVCGFPRRPVPENCQKDRDKCPKHGVQQNVSQLLDTTILDLALNALACFVGQIPMMRLFLIQVAIDRVQNKANYHNRFLHKKKLRNIHVVLVQFYRVFHKSGPMFEKPYSC